MKIVESLNFDNFANYYGSIAVESANMIVTRHRGSISITPLENAGKRGKWVPSISIRYKSIEDDFRFIELLSDHEWNLQEIYQNIRGEEEVEPMKYRSTELLDSEVLSAYLSFEKGVRIKSPFVKSKWKGVEPKVTDSLEVGSIIYESWGYDQTNIDFYCVVQVKGKFVTLLPMNSKISEAETSFMTNQVVAGNKINFLAKELRREWKGSGCSVRGHGWAKLWNGKELRESHYA